MTGEQLIYEQPEICRLLHISRPTFYRYIREGKLPCIRLGRKVFISKVQLERLLSGENAGCQPAQPK